MAFFKNLQIETHHNKEFINITNFIKDSLKESKVKQGILVVYCPHTTGAITINENADPNVQKDLTSGLSKTFSNLSFLHDNSDAHLKSSVIGPSETFIIENNSLVLGIWQNIYFAEFDGPRTREFYIKIIEG